MDREQIWLKAVFCSAAIVAAVAAIFVLFIDYQLKETQLCMCPPVPSGPACPDDWIGYQGKCYYFSTIQQNWHLSQNSCTSHNASLLTFHHNREKNFVMRYNGKVPVWLGISKGPDQSWIRTNGGKLTNSEVTGEGDCAYLNNQGNAIGSKCTTELHWICYKPDVFNRQSET